MTGVHLHDMPGRACVCVCVRACREVDCTCGVRGTLLSPGIRCISCSRGLNPGFRFSGSAVVCFFSFFLLLFFVVPSCSVCAGTNGKISRHNRIKSMHKHIVGFMGRNSVSVATHDREIVSKAGINYYPTFY